MGRFQRVGWTDPKTWPGQPHKTNAEGEPKMTSGYFKQSGSCIVFIWLQYRGYLHHHHCNIWLFIFKWFRRWCLYSSKVVLLLQELIAICISIMFFRCWLQRILATWFSDIDCKILNNIMVRRCWLHYHSSIIFRRCWLQHWTMFMF